VRGPLDMQIIGSTIDDAAGEAFDKTAKIMGLPYPGGPVIDKNAQEGDPKRFPFAKPRIDGLDVSYSGLKTSILYFLRDELKKDPAFITKNMNDLCASIQRTIIEILTEKLLKAVDQTGIRHVAIGGGVAANSGLRSEIARLGEEHGWQVYIPQRRYTTDNAAMIAMAGYFQYLEKDFAGWEVAPLARMPL
jgi:N6-L-threonylcarbamoyladenine synthase